MLTVSHHGGLMSTLGDVIAQLRATLDRVGDARRLLLRGADHRDEAATRLAATLRGATAEDAARAQAHLATAGDQVATALAATDQAEQRIRAYLHRIGGVAAAPCEQLPAGSDHARLVRQIQQRTAHSPPGTRTVGTLVKPDGTTEPLCSGKDTPWYAETVRELRRLGGPAGRALARLATHIEVQTVLARMGADELAEATLVLSRRPCGTPPDPAAPFTCDSQLDNLIAATGRELRLTVIAPDGTVWVYPKRTKKR